LFAFAIAASWSAAADATIGKANVAPATKPSASLIELSFIFVSKEIKINKLLVKFMLSSVQTTFSLCVLSAT
jgi:hypothetical protein